MQINVSRETISMIRNICLLCLAACGAIIITILFKTKGFVQTKATIISTVKEVNNGIENDSQSTLIHYYHFRYTVNNEDYFGEYRTFFPCMYSSGKLIKIWYNQSLPHIIRDRFLFEILICSSLFFAIFAAFTSLGLQSVSKK